MSLRTHSPIRHMCKQGSNFGGRLECNSNSCSPIHNKTHHNSNCFPSHLCNPFLGLLSYLIQVTQVANKPTAATQSAYRDSGQLLPLMIVLHSCIPKAKIRDISLMLKVMYIRNQFNHILGPNGVLKLLRHVTGWKITLLLQKLYGGCFYASAANL